MTRKPPSDTSPEDASSRRGRLVARRNRRTRIVAAAVVIAIAGALAVGAYALNTGDTLAHAAGTNTPTAPKFGKDGTLVPIGAVKATAPRALNHLLPLKLWVGGDSLAGSFGPALGDQVGATGVVQTVIDYKVSSGLSSNDIRDWYQRATEQMKSANPDAVVFIIGANDAPIVNQVDANNDGIPDWQTAYRLKVARMMDLLVGPHHRTVFWLGPPTMGDDTMNRGAKAIGPIMSQEAAKRSPDVVYLNTYKLFSKDGGYSRQILDENGKEITARISDGTHFTEDGAQYLARAVFTLIDARWKLLKQADLLHPIGWTFADGTGELVPGFSSNPTSRYHPQYNNYNNTTTASTGVSETTAAPSGPSSTVGVTQPSTTTSPPPATTSPPTTAHTTTTGAKKP